MTASITLLGGLPEPEQNGLGGLADMFVANPQQTITVVAVMTAKKIEYDTGPNSNGDVKVKLTVEYVEQVKDQHAAEALAMMMNSHEQRTGITVLAGMAQAVADGTPVHGSVDPVTGEMA